MKLSRYLADADISALQFAARIGRSREAVRRYCSGAQEIYLCGGGAKNKALFDTLVKYLPHCRIESTDALGVPGDWVEAFAMAWLGWKTLRREPANLPEVTGAKGKRVLGAIYPA